jgi:hypothetical protein
VSLLMQHAKRMLSIILSSVAYLAVLYFYTLSHKRHDFRGKSTEHEMCVLIFCTPSSETFLILRRIERDNIINVHRLPSELPVILVRFYDNLIFLIDFRKVLQYPI